MTLATLWQAHLDEAGDWIEMDARQTLAIAQGSWFVEVLTS
jgi:hypothetical protein